MRSPFAICTSRVLAVGACGYFSIDMGFLNEDRTPSGVAVRSVWCFKLNLLFLVQLDEIRLEKYASRAQIDGLSAAPWRE
jgi:hypothetical protein